MAIRTIVHIDEEKCDGCGLCIPNCAEGAIKIVDGKARLIADKYCDGLGACLGNCPKDAISLIKREADEFDEEAVEQLLKVQENTQNEEHFSCPGSSMVDMRNKKSSFSSCPGSLSTEINEKPVANGYSRQDVSINIKPMLTQWPVQLMLVPVKAPYFENADLLITADCVAVAYPNYQLELLKDRAVVMGCPKLDDGNYYIEKLGAILSQNNVNSITVAYMEVPCCGGVLRIVQEAIKLSRKSIPVEAIKISITGERCN